jgi:SAM-dependent methyltransferase
VANRSLCPACQSQEATLVETVSVEALASAWTKEKCHGDNVDYETIYEYLLSDLKSTEVEFWQCQQCELEFAQPMRSWTAAHYPIEEHYLGFDHQVALLDLRSMSPSRVLDVGCADGQFLERGAALGHEMVGIDFAVEDIEAAKSRGLDARVCDVNGIRGLFAGEPTFNVICLFQIIEHLSQPDVIFTQLDEIATDDCRLLVGCPSALRYTRRFKHRQRIDRSDFWDYPPQHTLRWTQKALDTFLRRHGWQVESVMYEPLSSYAAAAHIAGIDDLTDGAGTKTSRRLKVMRLMLKMIGSRFVSKTTGICMLTRARRFDAPGYL